MTYRQCPSCKAVLFFKDGEIHKTDLKELPVAGPMGAMTPPTIFGARWKKGKTSKY